MSEDNPQINLKKFTRHQRKMPWGLIIRIVIAILIITGLYLGFKYLEKTDKKDQIKEAIEVEIEEVDTTGIE